MAFKQIDYIRAHFYDAFDFEVKKWSVARDHKSNSLFTTHIASNKDSPHTGTIRYH